MPATRASRLFRCILLVFVLLAAFGATGTLAPRSALAATATTTSALNLRVGFRPTSRVKLVMPPGAEVEIVNRSQNGYWKVVYQGVRGYAHGDYLDFGGGDTSGGGGGATGNATTTSSLNLRAGPSTSDRVLLVMPSGAAITLTGQSQNGFLGVTFQGTSGWASASYINQGGSSSDGGSADPGSGNAGTARTTSSLRLRSGPSTSSSILLTMPSGATVTLTGASQNGFLGVTYQGTTGWASSDYLSTGQSDGGGSGDGAVDPGSGDAGSARTTTSLRLRSGPSTSSSIILTMPSGATVTLTGSSQNGFSGVVYQGTSGWAATDYLSTGGGGSVIWPFASGGSWEIIQGYNGGTHNGTMYRFSLDLVNTSGATAGASIYAPVSGTVLWNDRNSGGLAIDMGNGYTMCMFHVTFSGDLTRGSYVTQGQWLGTISAPGGYGYAVTPHVDLTLWYTGGGGRVSTAFTGGFAISGYDFPESGSWNAYGGTVVYP